MKRPSFSTFVAILVALILGMVWGSAALGPSQARPDDWRSRECRYQGVDNATWTAHEEALTAACVVGKWSVPGGLSNFRRIIDCESGWNRLAYNPSGPYVGLGQHALSAWASRVRSYTPVHWTLRPAWSNSRTMLTITARMMHAVGLGPWSCA